MSATAMIRATESFQCGRGIDVRDSPALRHEHARNDREAILDPVIGFTQQQALPVVFTDFPQPVFVDLLMRRHQPA
jgi:hypothetical protein